MLRRAVIVMNPVGLHARPAAELVKEANKYTANATIQVGEKKANAKSILQLLSLGVKQGTTITIVTEGADAQQSLDALCKIIASE